MLFVLRLWERICGATSSTLVLVSTCGTIHLQPGHPQVKAWVSCSYFSDKSLDLWVSAITGADNTTTRAHQCGALFLLGEPSTIGRKS